jgi:hypothetical protein
VPDISAIPTHLRDLLAGRHIDLWLLQVGTSLGWPVALLAAAVPIACFGSALRLLRAQLCADASFSLSPAPARSAVLPAASSPASTPARLRQSAAPRLGSARSVEPHDRPGGVR